MSVSAERVQQIFSEALAKINPAERAAYIARTCAGDSSLAAEVESLLRANEQSDKFLAAPDFAVTATFGDAAESAGQYIGRYKLLQMIGEGGFGSVFMAEQQQPVRRRVALKIIKLGMDTRQVIARFEAERQALALMDHPNIAKVLDAGATDSGRPFFVMELVPGVPITDYCDQAELTTRERLELFLPVCQAVQHAHQKGIIHRDLKPNNVLVTLHDDLPVPKVIDFGIAKATHARLTEKTLFTAFGQFVGTPQYMSPEQAQMNGLDVDTRADVYSLGVLLYELLTGCTPFDLDQLRKAAYEEIPRIIREHEPTPPSTRLSTLGDKLATIASRRRADPKRLGQQVRGELDWIVMKCLEKDRSRRYDSAGDLLKDIVRHLQDEPVLARPTGRIYRLKKLVRRHKTSAAALTVAASGLLAGLSAASFGLLNAREERNLAVEAQLSEERQRTAAEKATAVAQRQRAMAVEKEQLAEQQAAKAMAVSRFLEDMLASAQPDQARGRPLLVRDILDTAVAKADAGAFADQPETELNVRGTIGRSYFALGAYAEAERQLGRALELAKRLHNEQDPAVVAVMGDLAKAIGWNGDRAAALELNRQVVERQRALRGNDSVQTAHALSSLATDLAHLGRYDEAEPLAREALAIFERQEAGRSRSVAFNLTLLGICLEGQGKHAEAAQLLRQSAAMQQELLGANHPDLSHTLHNLGVILINQGELVEAGRVLEQALAIKRQILGPDHPDMLSTLGLLEDLYASQDDYAALDHVLVERHARRIENHPDAAELAQLRAIIQRYTEKRQPDRAADWRKRLEQALGQMVGELDQQIEQHPDDAAALERRARLQIERSKFREALADLQRVIDIRPEEHANWYLAACLLGYLKERPQYDEHCRRMLVRFAETQDAPTAERTAKSCVLLADALGQAEWQTIDSLIDRALVGDHGEIYNAWFRLAKGMVLYRHGDTTTAIDWLAQAKAENEPVRTSTAELYLALAEQLLGHEETAQQSYQHALELIEAEAPGLPGGRLDATAPENWLIRQVAIAEARSLLGSRQ